MEKWKAIKDYENYEINTRGEVKNKKGYILRQHIMGNYLTIKLYKKKNNLLAVHRLVAKIFIPNPNSLPCVNHKDGNKLNNNVDNLEWCSYSENTKKAFELGLQKSWCGTKFGKEHPNYKFRGNWKTQKEVNQYTLDGKFIHKYNSATEVERLIKISASHISECCNSKRKSAGGYIWKYESEDLK